MKWFPIPDTDDRVPDVSARQRSATDLVKHIRKLRWIGMIDEAERLQIALATVPAENRVLIESPETD